MANPVRYIRKRKNGVFYYERRLPKAVRDRPADWNAHFDGKALFRESLRTKSQPEALIASEAVHHDFERRLKAALGQVPSARPGSVELRRKVTRKLLDKVAEKTRERVLRPWQRAIVRAELSAEDKAELERLIYEREELAEQLREVLLKKNKADDARLPDIEEEVARLIEDDGLDAPVGSDAHAILKSAVREAQTRAQREIDDMLNGKTSAIPERRSLASQSRAPKISEVLDAYVGQLRAPRTIREAKEAVGSFIKIIGDLPLDEISRKDVIEFCKVEGARNIGGKTKGSIARPVSPSTLKKKVGLLRAAINHADATDLYTGPNPASKIKVRHFTKPVPKALMPDKRPFTVHELQLIVNHPWFTGCVSANRSHDPGNHRLAGMHYWVPILAMHTGCRAGEIGGLRLSEVRIDHQHPHIVIQDNLYRSTKGSYRRSVPLLDILFELGFAKYVERVARAGHDRLFFDWKPPAGRIDAGSTAWSNASLIRSFNRTVVPMQLGSLLVEGARQEVTFHSFRGAFKTLLGRSEYNLPYNHKHEVVGHAKIVEDQRYVKEVPLEQTYPAIRRCRYQGLKIPSMP